MPAVVLNGQSGSIPACAGEPRIRLLSSCIERVYPRVCGGTRRQGVEQYFDIGLSPRVRGNRPPGGGRIYLCGSIPACAGEPSGPASCRIWYRVYPRVCGGTQTLLQQRWRAEGLSPRVRGNPCSLISASIPVRSIPACAGEPWRRLRAGAVHWVYPRVCGGTRLSASRGITNPGLSPRVRGNRMPPASVSRTVGSIPACAGEPSPARVRAAGGWLRGLSPRVRGNLPNRNALP